MNNIRKENEKRRVLNYKIKQEESKNLIIQSLENNDCIKQQKNICKIKIYMEMI